MMHTGMYWVMGSCRVMKSHVACPCLQLCNYMGDTPAAERVGKCVPVASDALFQLNWFRLICIFVSLYERPIYLLSKLKKYIGTPRARFPKIAAAGKPYSVKNSVKSSYNDKVYLEM